MKGSKHSEKNEWMRIVRFAVVIIREDINLEVYDSCNYIFPERLYIYVIQRINEEYYTFNVKNLACN